jgi:elongation factor G
MIGIKIVLLDGSSHEMDSTELAFKIAASKAFREAAEKAGPIILEPVMNVEITVPEDYAGNIMNDLNGRRAKISDISPRDHSQVISATIPLAEMFGYATKLRNLSQGRAVFNMEFSSFRPVPGEITDRMSIGIRN